MCSFLVCMSLLTRENVILPGPGETKDDVFSGKSIYKLVAKFFRQAGQFLERRWAHWEVYELFHAMNVILCHITEYAYVILYFCA